MNKLKNLLLYGGVTKDEYDKIREDILIANRGSLLLYSGIAFIGMGIMIMLSFFFPTLAPSRVGYYIILALSALLYGASKWFGEKYPMIILVGVYTFEAAILLFGIALGTIVEPNQASASFGILMFAVPLLFVDVPILTVTELIISLIMYYIEAGLTQTAEMLNFNMSFILPFGCVAVILCSLMMRVKVQRLLLDYNNVRLGERDQLTGLYNRRMFDKEIDIIRTQGCKDGCLYFEFDINELKQTNDTRGHDAGDVKIIAFAKLIREMFEPAGKCYRTGGDEFMVISYDFSLNIDETLGLLAEKNRQYNEENNNDLSFSAGAVRFYDRMDIDGVLQEADRLMYESKRMHYFQKNSVNVKIVDKTTKDMFESEFDNALNNREFVLYCQPQYGAVSKVITSAEALVRWVKPDGSIINPGEFIPVFEGSDRIIHLDKYMFRLVCEKQKECLDEGITPFPISVNISRMTLFSLGIIESYNTVIESFGIPKELVPLEITESSAFESTYFADIIKEFKDLGFKIHLDDFGNGYSSLNNLSVLSFDAVKLDKSLIDDIGNRNGDEVLRHIIEISHFMKMEVIAEGVENEAQLNFLKKLTCDTIQGYFFSKAIPFNDYKSAMINSINNPPENTDAEQEIDEAGMGSLKVTSDERLLYLRAMSSIYMTVHVINLIENTTIEFATTTNVKEHANKVHDAESQMKATMRNVVSPEDVDRVLEFVEFSTLPERMKGRRTISLDFVGVHFGRTRARFILVEADEYGVPVTVIFTTQVVEADTKTSDGKVKANLTDELTGVFNKTAYFRDADIIGKQGCLIGENPDLLNVSVFKINNKDVIINAGGLSAWDDVLVSAALIINSIIKDVGRVYRLRDNEFVVLAYEPRDVYERKLQTIADKANIWIGENSTKMSISVGNIRSVEYSLETVDQLVEVAGRLAR